MGVIKDMAIGFWIMHQGQPHQIKRKENVAYGTHSHSKTKLFLQPLLGGAVREATFAHNDKVEEVDIVRKNGQVIAKLGKKVQIMDPVSYETLEADISQELFEQVREGDEVIFVNFNGIKVLGKR